MAEVLVRDSDGEIDEEERMSERNSRRCKTWAPVLDMGLLDELRHEGLSSSDDCTTCSSRSPSKETVVTDPEEQADVSPLDSTAVPDEEEHCPKGDTKEGGDEYEFFSDTDSEGGDVNYTYSNGRAATASPSQPAAPQPPAAPQQHRYSAPAGWCHWAAGSPQQSQLAPASPPAVPPGWHGSVGSSSAGASPMSVGGGRKVGGRRTKATKVTGGRSQSGRVTTVMVRNLHCTLKQQDFVRELDASGFEGTYDVCYLPRDFSTGQCKGYAFVNFKEPADATRFRAAWHQTERFGCSDPVVDVSPAHIQGYEANAAMANSSHVCKVRNPSFRRLILNKDQAAEQPPPSPLGAAADPGSPAALRQREPAAAPRGATAAFAAPPGYAVPRSPASFHGSPCHEGYGLPLKGGPRFPGLAGPAPQELLSTYSNVPAQPQQVSIFTLGAFSPQRGMYQEAPTIPVTSTPNYCSVRAR